MYVTVYKPATPVSEPPSPAPVVLFDPLHTPTGELEAVQLAPPILVVVHDVIENTSPAVTYTGPF